MSNTYTVVPTLHAPFTTDSDTNAIIVGSGIEGASIIDPTDSDLLHLAAVICAAKPHGRIRRILITGGYKDRIGGAQILCEKLDAHVFAWSCTGLPFAACEIPDGMQIPAGNETLQVIHTPGHRSDHLCFFLEQSRVLFVGDLLAAGETMVIAPPEGDLGGYLHSLRRLQQLDIQEIVPAHGPAIRDPQARLAALLAQYEEQKEQVLQVLHQNPRSMKIAAIAEKISPDADSQSQNAIASWVHAHLIKLERENCVIHHEKDDWSL